MNLNKFHYFLLKYNKIVQTLRTSNVIQKVHYDATECRLLY